MELKDFIKETLIQVSQGVYEAQEATKEYGVIINPDNVRPRSPDGGKYISGDGWTAVQDIEINVAVSVNEKEGSKAGIGVVTGLFSAGGSTTDEQGNSTVSTVKFKVPIVLPTNK